MLTHTLGFSRMGKQRELKKTLESFWKDQATAAELQAVAREIRQRHWTLQKNAGIDMLPVGDFSLYDQMLDMSALLGAVPQRYGFNADNVDLETFFLMARGGNKNGQGLAAMEMSKWFDTNYHYIVPELAPDQRFALRSSKLFDELEEARALDTPLKAVLPGPFTYLNASKATDPSCRLFDLLPRLLEVYTDILRKCARICQWIQLDEPVLAQDLPPEMKEADFRRAYETLAEAAGPARLLLATYFGSVTHNSSFLNQLPVAGLHIDLVRAPEQLQPVLDGLAPHTLLSLGLVNGRNIWKVEADKALELARTAADAIGPERLLLAPSCSLLHVPVDLDDETALPGEIRNWMAFGKQKCEELRMLADAASGKDCSDWLQANRDSWASRRKAPALHNAAVRDRVAAAGPEMLERSQPYPQRRKLQEKRFGLPLLPTTTIGSFPQTAEIRNARRDFKRGDLDLETYTEAMRGQIREVVAKQEELDLDVLVHGEPERNDMVEYFGEQLEGYCFTQNGWVQSYGSRCVKPPVIYGDVFRPQPMTVAWSSYAQSLTKKPMKGMLTGPVTILCWSFVRDDQPRSETCRQIALAIRDEVKDLEQAGLGVIQVDEPALREGAPLRKADWDSYFRWAVDSFRLAINGAAPETQMHTHMCYSEFNEIVAWIAAMDADVISIEASRSKMELLEAFKQFDYPNEIGPGVYDIHSPRVPGTEEMAELLRLAAAVIPVEKLWANPDCGLKTRGWEESYASLKNLVQAAKTVRKEFSS